MAERTETLVLRWSSRYGRLEMEESASLDEALRLSKALADDGAESLECIEVWDDAGYRVIPGSEALATADARFPDPPYERPRYEAIVEVMAPPAEGLGRRMSAEWFETREKAEQKAARLRRLLGDDRVRVVKPRVVNGVAMRPL